MLATSASLLSHVAQAKMSFIDDAEFFGEARYRFEHVDQDNALENAKAHTLRTNFGIESGEYKGLKALVEAQMVTHLGSEKFNSLNNGETGFSTVADPDTVELNRAWVEFSGLPETSIKLGRQFINLNNQRFVGTVGWRQNDQTFDSFTVSNTSIDKLKIQYSYVDNVDRIFEGIGDQQDSDTHLLDLSYKFNDWVNASVYGYWMDFEDAASLSNETYGIRLTGKGAVNDSWTLGYEAEYAQQNDYADNTASYDEGYYHVGAHVSGHGFTFGAGHEVLESDDTNAFKTPLATLHKFNGWADMFLNTPAAGLEDSYAKIVYKPSGTDSVLDGTKFLAMYHDFSGEEGGDFGSEIDLSVSKSFDLPEEYSLDNLNVQLKYADYNAEDAPYVDTQKIWFQIGTKF